MKPINSQNYTTANIKPNCDRSRESRRGLVLLVVLGMLGLFSLLAVTYMVFSGQSRTASVIINRAKLQSNTKLLYDPQIIPLILRGTEDRVSAFMGHSLLGDVYGRHAIEGSVKRIVGQNNNTWYAPPNGSVIAGLDNPVAGTAKILQSDSAFCKIALENTNIVTANSTSITLNEIDDTYNARLFTMLQGPLAGHSFRILKYIGDENNSLTVPPLDPLAYSILIDLTELPNGIQFTGVVGSGTAVSTRTESIGFWVGNFPNALFYNAGGIGYKYLINDAVYNGVGYGLSAQSGNLTQTIIDPATGNTLPTAATQLVPVGLLPNMDYMKLSDVGGSTNEGIDVPDVRDFWLSHINPNGDAILNPEEVIPSYHRPELVNYLAAIYAGPGGASWASRTVADIRTLLQLVDHACARPLPLTLNNIPIFPDRPANAAFEIGTRPFTNIVWSGGGGTEIIDLENYLASLVKGPWDVDTDGDGIAESVWVDPDLPTITAPDGKILKVMSAVQIVDLDSRINVNLAGDTTQALRTYDSTLTAGPSAFSRTSLPTFTPPAHELFGQGNGVGPGELGLTHLLQNFNSADPLTPTLEAAQLEFVRCVMRARNGDDYAAVTTGPFPPYLTTGVPGRRFDTISNGGNDFSSNVLEPGLTQQSNTWFDSANKISPRMGYPIETRGRAAYGLDRNGNISMYRPELQDASGTAFLPDELTDDPYELSQNPSPQDEPFTLEELERVVRRFDQDVTGLSDRLLSILQRDNNPAGNQWSLMSEINNVVTTRSHELRNPPIGFAGRDQDNSAPDVNAVPERVVNLFEWITLLHEHHYRVAPGATETTANDPSMIKNITGTLLPTITPDVLRALFPIEFRHGLKFDLNRRFGNGEDDNGFDIDGDGTLDAIVVDDPTELFSSAEREVPSLFPAAQRPIGDFSSISSEDRNTAGYPTATPTTPGQERYPYDGTGVVQSNNTLPATPSTTSLQSRQHYARQLYCLAQLIVPQEYKFSTMTDLTKNTRQWYKRRARTLAQWAINVVDFRDSDSVMTRFDFDYLPFGIRTGVSGITTVASGFGKDAGWTPETGDVVWGMEYPELLLTETLAFHDTRIRMTTNHTNTVDPTPKAVQYRIPQGSLYVELFNPRTAASFDNQNVPALPKELYTSNGVNLALNLALLAPAATTNNFGRQPVWRIGIAPVAGQPGAPAVPYDQTINTGAAPGSPLQGAALNSPFFTNQISEIPNAQFNGLVSDLTLDIPNGPIGSLPNQIEFERMIWFTNQLPSQINTSATADVPNLVNGGLGKLANHKVFINKSPLTAGNTTLPVGSYLALGPRTSTFVGSRRILDLNTTDPQYEPSPQEIRMDVNSIRARKLDGTLVNDPIFTANRVKAPLTMILQAEPPDGSWQGPGLTTPLATNEGIGVNISEPLPLPPTAVKKYYRRPTSQLNTTAGSNYESRRPDSYVTMPAGKFTPEVFDDVIGTDINQELASVIATNKTHADFRTLYLQRLADPMQPYDPNWNPYITIDVMSADLTLFTGENDSQTFSDGTVNATAGTYAFESRFKDGRSMDGRRSQSNNANPVAVAADRQLHEKSGSYFSSSTAQLVQTQANATLVDNAFFNYELGLSTLATTLSSTTLGYLNAGHTTTIGFDGFGLPMNVTGTVNGFSGPLDSFIGAPDPATCLQTGLFWPNRDFANSFELALVPYTGPGQLGATYTSALGLVQSPPENVYADSAGLLPGPFGHLMNFFESNERVVNTSLTPVNTPGPNAVPRKEPNWMRRSTATDPQRSDMGLLLSLVETTPRYKETMTPLNPLATNRNAQGAGANNHTDGTNQASVDMIRDRMLVDFHSPYNRRQSYTNPGKINLNTIVDERIWNAIDWNSQESTANRQAATITAPNIWQQIVTARRGFVTTANPLNPNIDIRVPSQFAGAWTSPFVANITSEIKAADINSYRADTDNALTLRRPLDATNPINPTGDEILIKPKSIEDEANAQALLTYQTVARLSNLTTNQSNVFAIWITVGLFEWDPVNGFGKEYVGTSGKADRQRSFYIIDRTVPVAYREGDSYNTEKAILLRRSIPQ